MIRRGQQGRQRLRKARREVEETLESPHGSYRPDRGGCRERRWETAYNDANTVRLQFIVWQRGKALVDFVVNVDVLGSEGWETIEYFDCCHGHCHLHTQNSDLEPRPIAQLDSIEDVRHAFAQVEQDARDRARIIREEG